MMLPSRSVVVLPAVTEHVPDGSGASVAQVVVPTPSGGASGLLWWLEPPQAISSENARTDSEGRRMEARTLSREAFRLGDFYYSVASWTCATTRAAGSCIATSGCGGAAGAAAGSL